MRRMGVMLAVGAGLVGLPVQAQAATVAVWHMDETSGNVMADSAGTNAGRLVNVKTGVPGVAGTAYRFNGSSSYVDVPSSAALNPGNANISFTAYVRYTTPPPSGSALDYDIVRKGTASDSAQFYKLEIRSDNRAVCRFVGSKTSSSGLLIHTGPRLNDGRWHSLTCRKTSSRIRLIVDGTTFSKSGAVGSISNSGPLTLGAKPGNHFTDFYAGDMDEVSVAIG